jgi:hypothetical protein
MSAIGVCLMDGKQTIIYCKSCIYRNERFCKLKLEDFILGLG